MNPPIVTEIWRRPSLMALGAFGEDGIDCGTWLPIEEVDGEPVEESEMCCAVCGRSLPEHLSEGEADI